MTDELARAIHRFDKAVTAPAAEPAAGRGRPPGLRRRVTKTAVRGADRRIAAVIECTEWVP